MMNVSLCGAVLKSVVHVYNVRPITIARQQSLEWVALRMEKHMQEVV